MKRLGTSPSRLVPEGRVTPIVARLIAVMLVLTSLVLGFVPWQQTATGKGRVIALAPVDRPHTIEAPLDGRIARWHVGEGARVKEGQLLVELTDNDPEIQERLLRERKANEERLSAARARLDAISTRVSALGTTKQAATTAAGARARMAERRVDAAREALTASSAGAKTAELNVVRQRDLEKEGLASRRTLELAELEVTRARTEEERSRAALYAAEAELLALGTDRTRAESDATAALGDAQAARGAAFAEIAAVEAELARIDVRIARQSAQRVAAPRHGTIVRVVGREGGDIVKAGDLLAVLVPDTHERAVELWLDGNDASLVHAGREVRVQFEGWPAVQVSGWPRVSTGTFAGRVLFVDPSDDGQGRFRAIVVPSGDWPPHDVLRQGVRASGWVLLSRVSLGWELWRRMNAFPAEWIEPPVDGSKDGKDKDKEKGK